jgi:pentatricopeptide repeat protein
MKTAGCAPGRITYNVLFNVYGKAQLHGEALNILSEMENNKECQPDIVTYSELTEWMLRQQITMVCLCSALDSQRGGPIKSIENAMPKQVK